MLLKFRYILMIWLALFSTHWVAAQLAMPDHVCVGAEKHYWVDNTPGSSYQWKIDGVIQPTTTNELIVTWNGTGTFLVEVRELSINGCPGPLRSGQVFVDAYITPDFQLIGPLCQSSPTPGLPPISNNGVSGTWNPTSISTAIPGTTTYTFTPDASQCAVPVTMDIKVNPVVTPQFNALGPFCEDTYAPDLPVISATKSCSESSSSSW